MTGKTTKAVMAIFAVALMMMVAFVPAISVLTDDGSDAASGEVFKGYTIQLYKEGDADYSGLVYFGDLPAGISANDYTKSGSGTNSYWVNNSTGMFLRCGDIPGYVPTKEVYQFPMIQVTYTYKDASVNNIKLDYEFAFGTTVIKSGGDSTEGQAYVSSDTQSTDKVGNVAKYEGVKTITLTQPSGITEDRLCIAPESRVGDFKVTVNAAQGAITQTVTKTVNAGTAVTVSGTVYDNGSAVLANATVKTKINNDDAATLTTDKDGKFSFNVVKGVVVALTVSYTSDNYTFTGNNSTYNFGTVNASVSHDFKANEKTATITVNDANNSVLRKDVAVGAGLAWYSEASGSTASVKEITKITTDVKAVEVSYSAGVITVAYIAPASDTAKAFYLIADATDNSPYTFTKATITVGDDKDPISTQIANKGGSANIAGGSGTFTANQKTAIISVYDAGSNPAALTYASGHSPTVSAQWYSQKANAGDATKYDIATSGSAIAPLAQADKDGKVYFAYTTPTAVTGTKFVLVVDGSTNNSIYSFNTAGSLVATASTQTIADKLSGKAGSVDATGGSGSINAKETTFSVSGTIADINVENVIDGGVVYDTSMKADVSKTGAYLFYVVKDTVVSNLKLSNVAPLTIASYTPNVYNLGTITANVTANFTKVVTPVDPTALYYKVTGLPTSTGVKVTFAYTVDGTKYTSTVTSSTTGATAGTAILTFNAKVGAAITVSATADGYTIPAFDGYTAAAYTTSKMYFVMYDDDVTTTDKVAPNFKVDYKATQNGKEVTGTLTADKNGIATLDIKNTEPMTGFTFSYGIFKVIGTSSTTTDVQYAFGDYTKLDVTNFNVTEGKGVEVTVSYQAANNQYSEPSYADIAEDQKLTVKYGATVTLTAPSYNGFDFKCWMIDGVSVGDKNTYVYTAPASAADASSSSVYIDALYGATQVYNGTPAGINSTVLIIGIIAVVIALIAVAYVVIQTKKKD